MSGTHVRCELWDDTPLMVPAPATEGLLDQLRALAMRSDDLANLGGELFESLRKHSGQDPAREILLGIQHLASINDPAGGRLLAALLDVATPALRLIPMVRNLSSVRRLWISRMSKDDNPGLVMETWKEDFHRVSEASLVAAEDVPGWREREDPGWEPPFGQMRTVLVDRIGRVAAGYELSDDFRELLVALLRLEVDAWQERISHLAGTIHPFNVTVISRVLPMLSRSDSVIRDLRYFIDLIDSGHDQEAFTRPRLRATDILDEREMEQLRRTLAGWPDLAPLAYLFSRQEEDPIPGIALSFGIARLQALAARLQRAGLRKRDLDLLGTSVLVFRGHNRGEFSLDVPDEHLPGLESVLAGPHEAVPGKGPACWSLEGVEMLVGQLVVVLPEADAETRGWPHHLPTLEQPDPLHRKDPAEAVKVKKPQGEEEEQEEEQITAASMKNLVLTNIQSASLVLGFLRDPKFTSVPGLVESVVTRTRNPQVLETVAHNRALHTGFANRTVPMACLRSPVNVPVKTLRRFIHVKFVSKIDLKRMAQDKTGIRKEVAAEIEKYLESLA